VAAGMPVDVMLKTMQSLDYAKFRDEGVVDRLGLPGKGLSLLLEKGIYEGVFLRNWLAGQLEALGVRTFGDLKITEPWAMNLPPEQRYKLVVVASDISGGRLARLPWDYKRYGLDPDSQLVADAVRASMSIPFFYEPIELDGHLLVDGGMLSNFPISLFDDENDWPTFGIKLSAQPDANMVANPVNNTYEFVKALLATMINAHDQMHIDDPCTAQRTMFVDTFKIKATDFDIKPDEQQKLFESGKRSAEKFLKTWDFSDYKKACPIS
jgi:NTE family protein